MNEEQILEMLENREYKELKIELEKMYPVDLAELLEEFDEKQRIIVFRLLSKESAAALNAGFVTKNEVAAILQKKGIYPVGKKMDRVHTKTLEKELDKHPLINEAQCYKTPNGKICVEVTQRVPILHIMSMS